MLETFWYNSVILKKFQYSAKGLEMLRNSARFKCRISLLSSQEVSAVIFSAIEKLLA
jgi:hypothetical protein